MKKKLPIQEQGLFEACPVCKTTHYLKDLIANAWVCPKTYCGHHLVINAEQRLHVLTEPSSFVAWDEELIATDPLAFPGYVEKLELAVKRTGMNSAAVTGSARIGEHDVAMAIVDYSFIAGAMNSVVGEKLARAIDRALQQKLPLVIISGCGGGAMMYEGLISLMQMPIVTGALLRHKLSGLPSVCVLTHSTYGGAMASWASLAQITLAEPKAGIGFVGDSVSKGRLLEATPPHFRKAEYQLEHGAIDKIVLRTELKQTLISILACSITRTTNLWQEGRSVAARLREALPKAEDEFLHDQCGPQRLTTHLAMDHVAAARNLQRPHTQDYIQRLFQTFFELHGDRYLKDDGAIVGGLATFEGLSVVVIGHQKNRTMKEKNLRNYGMAGPAGYRKALRLMELAEQRNYPLICLVDTPGADDSAFAENHGISFALAKCQERLFALPVPVLSVITGEGGSGGAVALAVADRVLMMEYAIYSVIAPKQAAKIIWKDEHREAEAAEYLKITAKAARDLNIIDTIVPEPPEGAHLDFGLAAQLLKAEIANSLSEICGQENLLERRYQRFRSINSFLGV